MAHHNVPQMSEKTVCNPSGGESTPAHWCISWRLGVAFGALFWVAACGGGTSGGFSPTSTSGFVDPNALMDTSVDEASSEDTATPDSASMDSALEEDSGRVPEEDTAPDDTGSDSADVQPMDTALVDSGPEEPEPTVPVPGIIYLVMPDRFANGSVENDQAGVAACHDPEASRKFHGGDLVGLRQQLDYIEMLGVDTLWTTPVYAQVGVVGDSCGYHGYWADFKDPDDGAVEPKLGGAEALEALMAAMEAKGMGLMLDMVVNHAGYGATLLEQQPTWFHGSDCAQLGDPEVTCGLAGLPDLAQEQEAVADYLDAKSAGWVRRYPIAGIRMDTVKHVPLDYFRDRWLPTVRGQGRPLFIVGEYLDGSSVERYAPYLEAGFDSMFNFHLRDGLVQVFARGGRVNLLAERVQAVVERFGVAQALKMTNLLDNHDVPRFTEALLGDDITQQRRYHLALVALMTLPGVPQLYYGNELGMRGGNDPDNRRDMPVWAWDDAGRRAAAGTDGFVGRPAETVDLVRDLGRLRSELPALREGGFVEFWRPPHGSAANLYAYLRTDSEGGHVLVILHNGLSSSGTVELPVADHAFLSDTLKAALADGTLLTDRLGRAGLGPITIREG
ncbi:MAG: alpha-amylase family glycosyl hydrolase, partial [Myxococcota bacterium]